MPSTTSVLREVPAGWLQASVAIEIARELARLDGIEPWASMPRSLMVTYRERAERIVTDYISRGTDR